MRTLAFLAALALVGCNQSKDREQSSATKKIHDHDADEDDHGDNVQHAGPYHAKLTSHLSEKEGNELDLHFETVGLTPKPIALALEKIAAKAKRAGDDKEYDLTFEPAPADERPKDEKPGTCSHYVAKAPFMKSTDILTVTMKIVIREKERTVEWKDFEVKKFGHKH